MYYLVPMATTHRINARFWEHFNGDWVKITLRDGDCLVYSASERTEEGYASSYYEWQYNDHTVSREYSHYARDCDGPHESHGEDSCFVTQLQARDNYYKDKHDDEVIRLPKWTHRSSRQRDVYAERMGY